MACVFLLFFCTVSFAVFGLTILSCLFRRGHDTGKITVVLGCPRKIVLIDCDCRLGCTYARAFHPCTVQVEWTLVNSQGPRRPSFPEGPRRDANQGRTFCHRARKKLVCMRRSKPSLDNCSDLMSLRACDTDAGVKQGRISRDRHETTKAVTSDMLNASLHDTSKVVTGITRLAQCKLAW